MAEEKKQLPYSGRGRYHASSRHRKKVCKICLKKSGAENGYIRRKGKRCERSERKKYQGGPYFDERVPDIYFRRKKGKGHDGI